MKHENDDSVAILDLDMVEQWQAADAKAVEIEDENDRLRAEAQTQIAKIAELKSTVARLSSQINTLNAGNIILWNKVEEQRTAIAKAKRYRTSVDEEADIILGLL